VSSHAASPLPFSSLSHPGHARSRIGASSEGAVTEGGAAAAGGAGGAGGEASTAGEEGALVPVPTEKPPPVPPDARAVIRGRAGGLGAVGTAAIECRSGTPDGCSPLAGEESTTTGPGRGSATIGAREGGALSSVALPTATTIIVGTEVRATSSAEVSSGRRLGENGRCVRTSDTTHSSKAGAGRQWD
jgi:hypothetical protein